MRLLGYLYGKRLVLLNVINLLLFNLACASFRLFSCLSRKKNLLSPFVDFRKYKLNLRDNYSMYSNIPITLR